MKYGFFPDEFFDTVFFFLLLLAVLFVRGELGEGEGREAMAKAVVVGRTLFEDKNYSFYTAFTWKFVEYQLGQPV